MDMFKETDREQRQDEFDHVEAEYTTRLDARIFTRLAASLTIRVKFYLAEKFGLGSDIELPPEIKSLTASLINNQFLTASLSSYLAAMDMQYLADLDTEQLAQLHNSIENMLKMQIDATSAKSEPKTVSWY